MNANRPITQADLDVASRPIVSEATAPRKPEPRALTLRIADGIVTVTLLTLLGFVCALFAGA